MNRFLSFFVIVMSMACSLQAAHVGEASARHVADQFFSARASRFTAPSGPSAIRLAYTAERERFYVFERGNHGGFVIVAGDDRLPQVLGYGDDGDFSANSLPPSVQYWMDEMNRQIAFLQSHGNVAVHHPAKREEAVGPLLTTRWNQIEPYNNYCPTYTLPDGTTERAVTGCVATATAQIMNYHQWPPVGRGSHSYVWDVAGLTTTELSADFSQSVYHWDLMLDEYDENSSPESCDAVAKLMSDVGISMDMQYGSSSAAWEYDASAALISYFGYGDKCYWLSRDICSAAEWDQLLVDELSLNRPVMYVGATNTTGHAFVLDGFDTEGYFHVNWGWGGRYDGYFLVSFLAPPNYNFKYDQRGLFGLLPETQADAVDGFINFHGQFYAAIPPVSLGTRLDISIECVAEGNMKLDTVGYEEWNNKIHYYGLIPMKFSLYDKNGVECSSEVFSVLKYLEHNESWSGADLFIDLPQSLEEGEYYLKLSASIDEGVNYDFPMLDYGGNEAYVRVVVQGDSAYLKDCFLHNTYGVESFAIPSGIQVNDNFNVGVSVSYKADFLPGDAHFDGPVGNVYLSLMKDGVEVANSPMCEVMVPTLQANYYEMELTAPSQWGRYELALNDEGGKHLTDMIDWYYRTGEVIVPVYIMPDCPVLYEDFETMTANSSTSERDVQGNFTTWTFTKSGVRAPGEGRCNGTNAIMMKKGSTFYNTQPLRHNFLMAEAIIFNQSSAARYTLEYSLDGGTTWQRVNTIEGQDAIDIPARSQVNAFWPLDMLPAQPVNFRVAMIAGSAATYIDDFTLYYTDSAVGDVNVDGEVNIADVNAVIDTILSSALLPAADVNDDGEINIADINALLDIILGAN